MEIEPFKEFAAAGLYCTFSVTLCDGASASGVLKPLAITCCPFTPTCVIVVVLFPLLVIVMF